MSVTLPPGSQVPYQRIGGAAANIGAATGRGSNTSIAVVPGGWFGGLLGVLPWWHWGWLGRETRLAMWDAAVWDHDTWWT